MAPPRTSGYHGDAGRARRGRQVSLTYWGGPGVGSNVWRNAEVVLLFDEFFLPRKAVIAKTQGHLLLPTSRGPLSKMNAHNARNPEVSLVHEGHRMRWTKQLAMRGRARFFDEHGVCGHQKLVVTGGLESMLLNKETMFPGAKVSLVQPKSLSDYTDRERLLYILDDPELPEQVHGKRIAELMGVEAWRDVSGDCINDATHKMIAVLGWRYVPRKTGSVFQRLAPLDADHKVPKQPSGSEGHTGQLRAARGSLVSVVRSRIHRLPENAEQRFALGASRYRLLSLIRSRIIHLPDDPVKRGEAQEQLLALYRAGYDLPQGWDF
jgi:hypothetical protein